MTKNATFLLALCACSPVIRVYSESPDAEPVIHDAGKLLGIKTLVVDAPGPGITTLELRGSEYDIERGRQLCGEALEKTLGASSVRDALTGGVVDCTPKAWSCATVTFVAHELGHVYGLPHVKQTDNTTKTGNLMQPGPGHSKALSDKQRTIIKLHALGLDEICQVKK